MKLNKKKLKNIDVKDFKYVSKYIDPNKVYHGSKACRYIVFEILHIIDENNRSTHTARYFSHTVDVNTFYSHWLVSIDMDRLNLDKYEVVAICDSTDRIHVKNGKWFGYINKPKLIGSITELGAMYKAIRFMIKFQQYFFSNRMRSRCKIFAEEYASDFKK
jgi:hypothetical protein